MRYRRMTLMKKTFVIPALFAIASAPALHAGYLVRTISATTVTTSQLAAYACYNAGGAPCVATGSDFVTTGPTDFTSYGTTGTVDASPLRTNSWDQTSVVFNNPAFGPIIGHAEGNSYVAASLNEGALHMNLNGLTPFSNGFGFASIVDVMHFTIAGANINS